MQQARVRAAVGVVSALFAVVCVAGAGGRAQAGGFACGEAATPIHAIQGVGRSSPLLGRTGVSIEGVVVGNFLAGDASLGGFFLQEEDVEIDDDPRTSEGIFVFAPELAPVAALPLGTRVRVRGEVLEFFGKTELARVDAWLVCGASPSPVSPSPASPVAVTLPLPGPGAADELWERSEGMAVELPAGLWLVDQFSVVRFGEVLVASQRQWQATQQAAPGPAALERQEDARRARLWIDDASRARSPLANPYLLSLSGRALRLGDRTTTPIVGVLDYAFGRFRLQPLEPPAFESSTHAPVPPVVRGALRVATWNVENLFNGDGQGDGFPTRGASSAVEYGRQLAKIVATLRALDADLLALVELENDGTGDESAVADLLAALAEEGLPYRVLGPATALGAQAISVRLLYRESALLPFGPSRVLDASVDARFSDRNRPALSQAFLHPETAALVIVAVAHLKSKGSPCDTSGDPDLGDGQGRCNGTRTLAAEALADWLGDDPARAAGAEVLLLGDLNAYPMEDPLRVLQGEGFVDLLRGAESYTFVFDGAPGRIDHALATPGLADRVAGAAVWHVNADASPALDYQEDNPEGFYREEPERASDHDPVLVGLFAMPEPESTAAACMALAVLLQLKRRRAPRGRRPGRALRRAE